MTNHTPTPWFVSGVRFRMNGGEWQSINRYDEAAKRDENIACVGYDPRNGLGQADANFIIKAVNNHDAMVKALIQARLRIEYLGAACNDPRHFEANASTFLPAIDEVLGAVGGSSDPR